MRTKKITSHRATNVVTKVAHKTLINGYLPAHP